MGLTAEEAATYAALQAKAAEVEDVGAAEVVTDSAGEVAAEVGAAVAEAVADVAQTVAAVVAAEVGDAHQQASAAVVEVVQHQAAAEVAEAHQQTEQAEQLADLALAAVTELADELPAAELAPVEVEVTGDGADVDVIAPGSDELPGEHTPAKRGIGARWFGAR